MISRVKHTLLIILVTLVTSHVKGQPFNPNYNFKQLNVQNGLTQNIVYHFLHDSRGYMWIGTQNGLSLYDGVKTTNFLHNEQDSASIGGNFISSILEDSSQQVWIGNENGIDLYSRLDNSFLHFPVDRPNGLRDKTFCVLLGFISASELWFLDTKTRSVRSFNVTAKTFSFVSELNTNHAFLYKGSRQIINIWSSYDKGTIHQVYKNKKLVDQQVYFAGKEGSINRPILEVSHVLQQNDSAVWLSTNEGLVKLNPLVNKYTVFNSWQQQPVRELRYAAVSPKGQLWLATGPQGVYTFDMNTNQFLYNFRNDKLNPYSICSDNIVSLYFDRTGNIWCGSYGNGSCFASTENVLFSNHMAKNETKDWDSNNHISWLGTDGDDNLWCMLSDIPGFWILDKSFKIKVHKKPVLANGASFNGYLFKLLFDKDGSAWCITNRGLYKFHIASGRMTPVKYDLVSDEVMGSIWIKDIIRLKDSSILFSTFVGLYRLAIEGGKPVISSITFLKPGEYNGFGLLFQDGSNFVYVKSLGHFLYILKPRNNGKTYELIKSLPFIPEVNHFYNEPGDPKIYIATTDGVYHIDTKNLQLEQESFNAKLPFLNVSSVFKKNGKFWVFGEKGLYFFDEKTREGRTYTVEDGLPTNEFSSAALVVGSDGRCIVGSTNGLVSFYPNQIKDSVTPPQAQLSGIYINDVLHVAAPNSNEIKKINLTFRQNTFSFDFSPITFHHSASCSFEYKLEGYDENWVKTDAVRYTRYSKIPPGGYVFKLRVFDAMGRVSPYTKTLQIEIARAFWQTSWFRIAILVIVLSAAWLTSRWYFRLKIGRQKQEFEKQQAIEKERTRIATDMHDDLGAGLSRIKFLSQSILNKKMKYEIIRAELEKITSFSDEMSEKMGEIVWALNEKNDTIADLIAYTRSYAVEYLANHDIKCDAITPPHLPVTFITGEMRRNIFLSVKECLHNIVKHAGASKVCFSVHLDGDMRIVIHDNGKGIDWKNLRAFSNGMQNLQRRMKEIKGNIEFANEQGAKVSLTIPLIL